MKDFRGLLRLTPRDLRLRGEIETAIRHGLVHPDLMEDMPQHFEKIEAGAFHVSIQASATTACLPQTTTSDLATYTAWEVWCGPTGTELRALGCRDYEILAWFGDDDGEPTRCVPTAVVQRYLDFIENARGGGPVLDEDAP